MESLHRPALLAAVTAALLVLNVVLLTGDDDAPAVAVDAPADDEDATGGDDGDVGAQEDGGDVTDEPPADGDQEDDAAPGTDGDDGTDDEGPTTNGALAVPAAGTYAYASSGTWSLTGGADPEEYELPATATAEVAGDGDGEWTVRLAAGDRYADGFTFTVGPDGGLDWTDWVLERTSPSLADATVYSCSGDTAWYRPDEQGRVAQHVCTAGAITSTGNVEHLGTEEVQLGDGTVVVADRLLYDYTVDGPGVSGDGQLDLWLDPATGLRVQEERRIVTTATSGDTDFEYREDVAFTLQSLDPA